MNPRERIVTALRGEMPDRVPWTIYSGLLPRGTTERELRNRGLGLVAHQSVYTMERPDVSLAERVVEERDEIVRVRTYHTPVGELTERRRVEPGYGSSWAFEHLVKEPRDYETLEYVVRDTTFHPDYSSFLRAQEEMGSDGVVNTAVLRVPFQRLWIEYAGLDRLLLDLHDYPELVGRVIEAMEEKDWELWQLIATSPAEFVWCPDNLTATAISPRIFDRYFAPHYHALADVMHRHGKRVYCHVDGTTRALVDRIAAIPIDIVEAFTPTPTGDLSVAEARSAWKDKVLWINFPSSVHVEPPEQVAATARDLLRQAAPGNGFLVGVTENVPEFAYVRSLDAITRTIEELGECPLAAG